MSELPPNDSPQLLPAMDLQWPQALDMLWSTPLHEDEVGSDTELGSSRLSTPIDDASSTNSSPRLAQQGAVRGDYGSLERAAAARRRKQYRERKKCELVELRGKCATLSAKLDVLLMRNDARKKHYKRIGNKSSSGSGGWEAVAFRQLQRRMAAEALNRDLRSHLRLHHDIAEQFGRSWKRQMSFVERQRPATIVLSTLKKEAITFDQHDMRLVASLLAEIQASRAHTDSVLTNCEQLSTSRELYSYQQNWRRDSHQGREFLEFTEKWTVPFGLDVAVPALQRTLPHMLAKECDPAVFQIPGADFATAIKYTYTRETGNGRTERYHNILVTQVFMEGHRATLCWRTVSEQSGLKTLSGSSLYDEHGWGVAQQLPGAPETAGTAFTFCTHLSARQPSSNENGRDHFEKHARKFGRTMMHDDEAVEWHDTLENVAMDGLIAMRTGSIAL